MFYLFFEVIFVTLVLKVFLKISKFLCRKTYCLAVSRLVSRVDALFSKLWKQLRKFQFLNKFRQRVSRLIRKCFATQTWPVKLCPMHLHISRVTHEWLASHWLAKCTKRQFLKGSKCLFSKILYFSSSQLPLPKSQIFFKNQPFSLEFLL